MKEFTITQNDAGQRLDRFLAKAVPLLPASLAQKYIRLKRVKLNGKRAERDTRLTAGDTLQLYINDEFFDTPKEENAYLTVAAPKLHIVYEDENILLVDKKPGQAVHPHDGAEYGRTLIDHIQAYLYAQGEDLDAAATPLYIPIDLTPNSGSTHSEDPALDFERACDFLIVIDGEDDSRVLVQERYEALMSTYGMEYYLRDAYVNTPEVDSPTFKPIYMAVTLQDVVPSEDKRTPSGEKAETGALHYGNADPAAEDYDSLADFCFSDDGVEIRIPWQLLNFSDPSQMLIHDDYYSCYGVENLQIESLYIGLATNGAQPIALSEVPLEGWGNDVTWHERLKPAYSALKAHWTEEGDSHAQ